LGPVTSEFKKGKIKIFATTEQKDWAIIDILCQISKKNAWPIFTKFSQFADKLLEVTKLAFIFDCPRDVAMVTS